MMTRRSEPMPLPSLRSAFHLHQSLTPGQRHTASSLKGIWRAEWVVKGTSTLAAFMGHGGVERSCLPPSGSSAWGAALGKGSWLLLFLLPSSLPAYNGLSFSCLSFLVQPGLQHDLYRDLASSLPTCQGVDGPQC